MQRRLGSKEYTFERIEFVPAASNDGLAAGPGIEPLSKMKKVLQTPICLLTVSSNIVPHGNALLFGDASIASHHRTVHAQNES